MRKPCLFAAHAGVPSNLLAFFLRKRLGVTRPIRYLGPATYQLMVQNKLQYYRVSDRLEMCRVLASHVKRYFGGMSVEAISYRIDECGIVKDCSNDAQSPSFRLNRVGSQTRRQAMVK